MKFENTEVFNFESAIRGMRNPLESWSKSDSNYCWYNDDYDCDECPKNDNCPMDRNGNAFVLGDNDLDLARRLINGGSEHRKFLRQIMISVDITAPIYWWKEFDTYKVGTTANSTSTMHKLASTPITLDCFEIGDYNGTLQLIDPQHLDVRVNNFIDDLEQLRQLYIQTKDKKYWKELIRWLPESWLQKRTVTMNYENLSNMCKQRYHHKLTEWSIDFINWAKTLPYAQEFIFDCIEDVDKQ